MKMLVVAMEIEIVPTILSMKMLVVANKPSGSQVTVGGRMG
jgi:hypothetical protein